VVVEKSARGDGLAKNKYEVRESNNIMQEPKYSTISLQDLKWGRFLPSHCATSSRKGESLDRVLMARIIHRSQILFMWDHGMVRWDPRAGPTWIHEIFVWDPQFWFVGPTILLWYSWLKNYVLSSYK
jgi:hypothetical protein